MGEKFKFPNLREHLKEGVKPIMVCVGTPEDFLKQEEKEQKQYTPDISDMTVYHETDWKSGIYQSGMKGEFFSAGPATYVISSIDKNNKSSKGLGRCTSLVVSGVDKQTKKNISFLAHQPPGMVVFMKDYDFASEDDKERIRRRYPFLNDLNTQLLRMKEKCEPGTIDAIIVGGSLGELTPVEMTIQRRKMNDYFKSVETLKEKVKEILGFKPRIENGPKAKGGKDSIRFDNEHRRLYLIRPEVNQDTGSFTQSDIEEEKKDSTSM
ncbi:MAG: hypothetical protein WC783_05560 [Candidatus Paceibacterota bacterium]|jgi:hypothetical protein